MQPDKRKRRPRGEPALGDVDATKMVFEAMAREEKEERRKKTERLQVLRVKAQRSNKTGSESAYAEKHGQVAENSAYDKQCRCVFELNFI